MIEERFSIPGAGAIIIKTIDGERHILIQERYKKGAENENGLIEIPAGKIRANENIYACLRREIREETNYTIKKIYGEEKSEVIHSNGYSVLCYEPFSSSQNIADGYPIMVQVFVCEVEDDDAAHDASDESKNVRWIAINGLKEKLTSPDELYPMHISALRKFCEKAECWEI